MKTTRFLFQTEFPDSGELLLYNTLNGALIAFEKDRYNQITEILYGGEFNALNNEVANVLYEEGFLVDDNLNEIEIVKKRNALGIADSNRLDVIIMPNMNCNFSCVYCYETHHKSGMDDVTEERLIAWLQKMIPNYKAVLISWFGGEPLLSYPVILRVQEKVQALCKAHNVILHGHITTNGSLLDITKAKNLLALGVHSYQITLDGPAETHNQMRPLKGGGASFEAVHENICALAALEPTPHIKLRVNFDERNVARIRELLHTIPVGLRPSMTLVCEKIFTESFGVVQETMERTAEIEDIQAYAVEIGFRPDHEAMEPNRFTFCYADRANQFTINYNGDIFKCTVQKFGTKHRLARLGDNGNIEWEAGRLERWMALPAFEEKCEACVFMPLCMGGCRKLRAIFGSVGDDCLAPFKGFDRKVQHYYASTIQESVNQIQIS